VSRLRCCWQPCVRLPRPGFSPLVRLRCRPSSLFPYTTLFRSVGFRQVCRPGKVRVHVGGDPGRWAVICVCGHSTGAHERANTDQDRKSTRLNSSHVKISYAVFCLKKKKQEIAQNLKSQTHNDY